MQKGRTLIYSQENTEQFEGDWGTCVEVGDTHMNLDHEVLRTKASKPLWPISEDAYPGCCGGVSTYQCSSRRS